MIFDFRIWKYECLCFKSTRFIDYIINYIIPFWSSYLYKKIKWFRYLLFIANYNKKNIYSKIFIKYYRNNYNLYIFISFYCYICLFIFIRKKFFQRKIIFNEDGIIFKIFIYIILFFQFHFFTICYSFIQRKIELLMVLLWVLFAYPLNHYN